MVSKHHNNESNETSLLKEILAPFKEPIFYLNTLLIFSFSSCVGSCFFMVGARPDYAHPKIIFVIMLISSIVFITLLMIIWNIKEKKQRQESASMETAFRDQKEKRREIFEQNKMKLESSPHQKLIEKFVATNQLSVGGSISKLKILLDNKGIVFDYEELKSIVMEEKERQDYENFKRTILHDRPTELRDYIVNLLDFYGENYAYQIDIFIKLLRENKIEIDENEIEIINDIRNVRREIELQQYENKLLYSEKSYSISDLDLLSGSEFELFLKELFEKMGYLVEHTKLSGDQGADLIISKFGHKVAVQAKNYTANVGNKAIQEVVSAIKHYKADRGMVVATSDFTQPAIELAKSNDIELIDRHRLAKLMEKYL